MRPNKYGAKRTTVDGVTFASKAEARRHGELKLLEKAGDITGLQLQPEFPFVINGRPVKLRSAGFPNGRALKYVADFQYWRDGAMVVEDVKGLDTPVSRLKRALVESIYGICVEVVK